MQKDRKPLKIFRVTRQGKPYYTVPHSSHP